MKCTQSATVTKFANLKVKTDTCCSFKACQKGGEVQISFYHTCYHLFFHFPSVLGHSIDHELLCLHANIADPKDAKYHMPVFNSIVAKGQSLIGL